MAKSYYLIKLVPISEKSSIAELVRVQKKVFDITEAYREIGTDSVESVLPAKEQHFPNCIMLVDEEGKFKTLPANSIATYIYCPDSVFDVIVGTALLCKHNPRTYNWEAFTLDEATAQMNELTQWISKIRPAYDLHVQYCVVQTRKN